MEGFAIISREPKLSEDEWLRCIAHTPQLVRWEPRVIKNPFTQLPFLLNSPASHVAIRIGDQVVGAIEPSSEFDENGQLHVTTAGTEELGFKEVVAAVVAFLSANVEWDQ